MDTLRHSRRLSRFCRWMLGIWLFALATSWAHACVLQTAEPDAHHALSEAVAAHEHDEADAGAVVCVERCETPTLTQPAPQLPDAPLPVLAPPPLQPLWLGAEAPQG